MKLFNNKKGDEKSAAGAAAGADEADYYDSPMETVSLEAKPAAQTSGGSRQASRPEPEEVAPTYGINSAIELMRALPVDQNVELVVQVIKTTLESLRVKVSDIIEDASRKQKDLEGRVANLKQQITEFEKEIVTRKDEIMKLEADHAETTAVKGRLELAEKAQKAAAGQKSVSGTIGGVKQGSKI